MVQTTDAEHLWHLSRALLHAIYSVFLPQEVSGLDGGDPISQKKILEGEGERDICIKETCKRLVGTVDTKYEVASPYKLVTKM